MFQDNKQSFSRIIEVAQSSLAQLAHTMVVNFIKPENFKSLGVGINFYIKI